MSVTLSGFYSYKNSIEGCVFSVLIDPCLVQDGSIGGNGNNLPGNKFSAAF